MIICPLKSILQKYKYINIHIYIIHIYIYDISIKFDKKFKDLTLEIKTKVCKNVCKNDG